MLIGNSKPEYYLIRTAILGLRLIAPASCIYCVVLPIVKLHLFVRRPFPLPISIWMIAEASFFLVGYLPLRWWLQRPARHPAPPAKEERQLLFRKCTEKIPDPDAYLSKWFLNAPPDEIKRENLKEFYAWSLMNKDYESVSGEDDLELDGYIDDLEAKFGRRVQPGRGSVRSLRGTLDPVPMQHRPIIWYMVRNALAMNSLLLDL